jgi:hypothetical protein
MASQGNLEPWICATMVVLDPIVLRLVLLVRNEQVQPGRASSLLAHL